MLTALLIAAFAILLVGVLAIALVMDARLIARLIQMTFGVEEVRCDCQNAYRYCR